MAHMNKRLFLIAATAFLTACGGAPVNQVVEQVKSARPSAIIFGDSLTDNGFVYPDGIFYKNAGEQIGELLGMEMETVATGGETTRDAFEGHARPYTDRVLVRKYDTFPNKIASTRATFVILRHGVASAANNVPAEVFGADLDRMVNIVLNAGKIPIVVGVSNIGTTQSAVWIPEFTPPIEWLRELAVKAEAHNREAQKVAARHRVLFVDIRQVPFTSDDFLDGFHPTQSYSRRQVEFIAQAIKQQVK
jgi:hypothetical protein